MTTHLLAALTVVNEVAAHSMNFMAPNKNDDLLGLAREARRFYLLAFSAGHQAPFSQL